MPLNFALLQLHCSVLMYLAILFVHFILVCLSNIKVLTLLSFCARWEFSHFFSDQLKCK